VVIGVRADGKKELVALTDRHPRVHRVVGRAAARCQARGMRAPVLAVGDGALGFWAALREVLPEIRQGRCWQHKVVNVLDCLPKSAQAAAARPSRRSATPKTASTPRRRSRTSPPPTAPNT
jgi:putative transposase